MEELFKWLLNYGVGAAFAAYLLVKTTPAITKLEQAVAANTLVLRQLSERLERRSGVERRHDWGGDRAGESPGRRPAADEDEGG